MLNDYITYDREFFNIALESLTQNEFLEMNEECILLKEKNRKILSKLISIYQAIVLEKDHQIIIPQILEQQEVFELANHILISLLPNYKSRILEYDSLLCTYPNLSIQGSCYYYEISKKNGIVPIEIQIPEKMTEYTIGEINHEKTHTLVMDMISLKQFPVIYLELLSMLIQKITNYEVERKLGTNTTHIIDNVVRTIDNSKGISILDILKDIPFELEDINNRFVYQYLNIKANDYLISDWYSDLLFEFYILEPKQIKIELDQIFSNKMSLDQMLNNHQINLQNKSLLPSIQKKIEISKKYSIKR